MAGVIDEPTTTVTVLRPMRDQTEDRFDPDQTNEPKKVVEGLRANISAPTVEYVAGIETRTTFRFFTDPFDVKVGDEVRDEQTDALYRVHSAIHRTDADYDECDRRSLAHVAGVLVTSTSVAR